ncbi:MAG: hypothetical protein A2751_01045 [Candidatus Doudnabacteria bacterium RIFCSPHIGHO2_01_FULL_46_14]|uniref:FCP1 homology domain-containing protein n=1 Tax=Candidatus Doudnabacteria bacterium RIFCSPHIGHO2_01_FULL_46_14 TaxID=1817824 RepID=A0A1F5NNT6_9BACT|nr:MAG: hypothetical protein A2751_01045 [Candidatus Doudnabacteria bacterium RIFCSPHIGHO2_01_FULL_46_14]
MIKAVIFDWGRTLYDNDLNREADGAKEILRFCKEKGCRMALVSKVSGNHTVEGRTQLIENSPLRQYLDLFFVTAEYKDKFLDEIVRNWDLPRSEIMIVDDRTVRGIKYGNEHGHPTVWLEKGKYAQELPNAETGQPTHRIRELRELFEIL